MARRPTQLELMTPPRPSAAERRRWIRERLHGYEFRQAAREAARREALARRKRKRAEEDGRGDIDRRQMTIDDVLRAARPSATD